MPNYEGITPIDPSDCVDCDLCSECGGLVKLCLSAEAVKQNGMYRPAIKMGDFCLARAAITQEHQSLSDAALADIGRLCESMNETLRSPRKPLTLIIGELVMASVNKHNSSADK